VGHPAFIETIGTHGKKSPNPVDRHVGARVRMRRMMLSMSQEKLGDALALRSSRSRSTRRAPTELVRAACNIFSHILQVPVSFFFEGAPSVPGHHAPPGMAESPSPAYVSEFLSTTDGLALTKAFMRIKNAKLRRRVVDLVEEICGEK